MTKKQGRSGKKELPGKSMKAKPKGNEKHHKELKLLKAEYRKRSNMSPEIKGSKKN